MNCTSPEALAEYFKVFSEPNRLMVLAVLKEGPLNVTAVVQATGLSQALVSKHLKLLTIAGVVQRKPKGSLVFYQVKEQGIFNFLLTAENQLRVCREQQFNALQS